MGKKLKKEKKRKNKNQMIGLTGDWSPKRVRHKIDSLVSSLTGNRCRKTDTQESQRTQYTKETNKELVIPSKLNI